MLENLLQLTVLFFVIFDPLASLAVFFAATSDMNLITRQRIATYALLVAGGLSFLFLLFGQTILNTFSININEFKVAGGVILFLLGIKMALGQSVVDTDKAKGNSAMAIAAIIGTPLITGPAAITAIIVSVGDFGKFSTGVAVIIVLMVTAIIFYQAQRINKFVGKTAIQVISTMLGLVTLAWGVKFITTGVQALLI